MITAEEQPLDHPRAIGVVQPIIHRLMKDHVATLERIENLAINPGALIGMRTRYGVKVAALVNAVNAIAMFQHEINNQSLDAVAAAHAAQVDRFLADVLTPKTRFPADDEQR